MKHDSDPDDDRLRSLVGEVEYGLREYPRSPKTDRYYARLLRAAADLLTHQLAARGKAKATRAKGGA